MDGRKTRGVVLGADNIIVHNRDLVGITGFSVFTMRCEMKIDFSLSGYEIAYAIIRAYDRKNVRHKKASEFFRKWNDLIAKYSDGINTYRVLKSNYEKFDIEAVKLETEFKKALKGGV